MFKKGSLAYTPPKTNMDWNQPKKSMPEIKENIHFTKPHNPILDETNCEFVRCHTLCKIFIRKPHCKNLVQDDGFDVL